MKYHKMNLQNRYQHGFTLAELMMVLVIISILTLVAMSAIGGNSNAASATAIRSGATEIAKSVGYIHAVIGNGIKTKSNPIVNGSATMLDVLVVGKGAVKPSFHARFDTVGMRPLESDLRVITRGGATEGKYELLSFPVTVTDDCPTARVCSVFTNVQDEVLDEILVRYGLERTTAGIGIQGSSQTLPVSFVADGSAAGTNKLQFALVP